MAERRQERRNETIIMAKLESIAIDIAVIKTKTEALEDHQKSTNGKVIAQESRLNSYGENQNLISHVLKELTETIGQYKKDRDAHDKEERTNWQKHQDKVIWGVIGIVLMLFYATLVKSGVISNFLG